MLNKQIQLLSIDTGSLYTNREKYLHNKLHKIRSERRELKTIMESMAKGISKVLSTYDIPLPNFHSLKEDDVDVFIENVSINVQDEDLKNNVITEIIKYYGYHQNYQHKTTVINLTKETLLSKLKQKSDRNIYHHSNPRSVRYDSIYKKNCDYRDNVIVSLFDSILIRTLGCSYNQLSKDIMIMQIYYFDIFHECIENGFMFEGEHYVYFSSSAGQIRTKRALFIKESALKRIEKTLMCGLSIDRINELGGCNSNKFLAYTALTNSATDEWFEFNIDKVIVVEDFETQVLGTFDFIDETDYSITRKTDYIPITHTDGCGMILPNAFGQKQVNKMIRLPWVKGLISPFDYLGFIYEYNCSPIIKDIYGEEHNIIKEDIQVILTKSQFKMHKYYNNWQDYKNNFKKYNCKAAFTNPEEDRLRPASINYQMLQSLSDITETELKEIAKPSINKLQNFCNSKKDVLDFFGVSPYNQYPTYFQQGIALYENLLNDEYTKKVLRDNKNSIVKRFRSGKLKIKGRYTFVLPDLFAFCEYLFKHNPNPKGLLNDGEVYCNIFPTKQKLDCLRSPHLYREHAIRKNMACNDNPNKDMLSKWFTTKAIYTSCFDLITKLLMLDCDGDTLLVIPDQALVDVAEKNMQNIVPLYYEMKKALPMKLNNQTIYDGLIAAFTGVNIGQYSNNISKIWNSETFISGTEQEKQHALDCIKRLCCQNNFLID